MATNLTNRALLVAVNVSQWSGRRHDKKVTDDVNRQHAASADAGRYNKMLVAPESIAPITAAANEARRVHYALSLPWQDNGARIMSSAGFLEFGKQLRAVRTKFDAAVDAFVTAYPAHIAAAQTRLNGMFDPTDYPAPADIAGRFRFEVRGPFPIPTTDFRVDGMSDADQAAMRADVERQITDAFAGAIGDAFERVHAAVERMATRLGEYQEGSDGKRATPLHATIIENVRELAAALPLLNVTGDARLDQLADTLPALCRYDIDKLKTDAKARGELRQEATKIAAAVADYF